MIWIVVPTRNEATIIGQNLDALLAFLHTAFADEHWRVIVADNASTDATRAIVRHIAKREPSLELLTFEQPGKGGAVLGAWTYAATQIDPRPETRDPSEDSRRETRDSRSSIRSHVSRLTSHVSPSDLTSHVSRLTSHVFAFCDADLATDLRHLPELIAAVRDGADIAAASRYLPGARVERSAFRTLVSRANRLLLRARFMLRMTDPPCGMKAVSERVVREIIPLVRDTQWFFDTELCIRAQRAGLRIVELPVAWHEPRTSRGSLRKVFRITRANLRAMRRV